MSFEPLLGGFAAQAADEVKLQLKWVTQAQFAGYYVALDNGFYAEEGLDVEIKPGGPDIAPAQVIAGGLTLTKPLPRHTGHFDLM